MHTHHYNSSIQKWCHLGCLNCRPIALTCVASKILERVVVYEVLHYLRKRRLITQEQYGFIAQRSTALNMFDALIEWSLAMKNRLSVAVAYNNFAKAFVTICLLKLCQKLDAFDLSRNQQSWIISLLLGRCQQTRKSRQHTVGRQNDH